VGLESRLRIGVGSELCWFRRRRGAWLLEILDYFFFRIALFVVNEGY
jgi:hypothetical protein